jgi:hypothetical protein
MLNVNMLNVIALNVTMFSVVAPLEYLKSKIIAQKTMMTPSMLPHTSANSDQKKFVESFMNTKPRSPNLVIISSNFYESLSAGKAMLTLRMNLR